MKTCLAMATVLLLVGGTNLVAAEYTVNLGEEYVVKGTERYDVVEKSYMPLRRADYTVKFKDQSCLIMNSLLCDTKDLSVADTADKMKRVFIKWAEEYQGNSVEGAKAVVTDRNAGKANYGYEMVLTDKNYEKAAPPPGEFKYVKLLVMRRTKDSFIMSIIMVNDTKVFADRAVLDLTEDIKPKP